MASMPPFTLEDMRTALLYVSPENRDTWREVGMGLKAEFGEDAFELWDDWSQGGSTYNKADARSVWRSMRGAGITLGSVVHMATQAGWKPARQQVSAADRKRMKQEAEERRKARQAAIEADDAKRAVMQQVVGDACEKIWQEHCKPVGQSPYLGRKRVGAHGIGFFRRTILLSIDDQQMRADVWVGVDVKRYLDDLPEPRPDHLSFLFFRPGTIAVPLRDIDGVLWALQAIQDNGTKLFPKYGRKSGCFHLVGELAADRPLAVGEGYATMATVHEATGWPALVALDAGNLMAVCRAWRERYADQPLVITGDDDRDKAGNPGRTKALEAAKAVGAVVALPQFPEAA